ncbi:hypothetical protein [Desulfobacca acetoxidans]|nr:hypothetical protein [Desulfobacca acetoxidans]
MEFTLIVIRDNQYKILGVAAIIRDVTARWKKDRALQRRLTDLEAQFRR